MTYSLTTPIPDAATSVITPEALAFVAALHRRFDEQRRRLLELRGRRQEQLDAGLDYDFLDHHDPVHGQHLGILLVELGVGITVAATMIAIFFSFAGRRAGK